MRLRIDSPDGTRKNTRLLVEGKDFSEEIDKDIIEKITWEFASDTEHVTALIKFSEVGLTMKKDCGKDVL